MKDQSSRLKVKGQDTGSGFWILDNYEE